MNAQVEPRVTPLAAGESLRPFDIEMTVMIGQAQTGGACSVLLAALRPGEGPPPHLHRDHDEYFFLLEGTISLVVNGEESTVAANTLAFVPRGTTHAFKNIGASPVRLLEWTIPGNNEPYFRAVHDMATIHGFDPSRLAEINAQFATEFFGP